jgi:uncharacterized membrane protein HdeD (DUF308 family)
LDDLARNWWAVLLRGVAGIVFGHVAVLAPVLSLAAFAPMFGMYAFADGMLAMASALRRGGVRGAWPAFALVGIVGMGTGLAVLIRPAVMDGFALIELIAPWALVKGAFEVAAAVGLRKVIGRDWLLALGGIASIGLGALLTLFPNVAELAVILGIAAYASVFGLLLTALGLRLRLRKIPTIAVRAPASKQAWADL